MSETAETDGVEDLHRLYPIGPFSDTFIVRLSSVTYHFQREAARAGVDTRPGVVASLAAIVNRPGLSQIELSGLIAKDKSMIVNMLHELVAQGWVVRKRSVTDRRRHELHITPQGREALERNVALLRMVEARLLGGMSPDSVAALRHLLNAARISCEESEKG